MNIKRGSTQTLQFNVDVDVNNIKELWLTFSKYNDVKYEIFTKTKEDVTFEGNNMIKVPLTQEETLSLNPKNSKRQKVYIQLRVMFNDGTTDHSSVVETAVSYLLKEDVME